MAKEAGVGCFHQPDELDAAENPEDVPQRAHPEQLDHRGSDKERKNTRDDGLVGHPEMMLVPPHRVVEPLAKVGFGPSSLLVEPAKKLGGCFCVALGTSCVSRKTQQTKKKL